MENYNEAMQYINNSSKGISLGLYSIGNILQRMGHPEKNLKIIHVGGTNGKGSTSTFIAVFLQEMGYKVGLYTSPYLEEFNERIQINKKNISKEELTAMVSKAKIAIDDYVAQGNPEPTEFEIITAAAYQYFYEQKVDYVVLEVGLGGELDATNTCEPMLSVLTSISMDHVDFLGDDLLKIAETKAGIIKKNRPVVLYHQSPEIEEVIRNKAMQMESELYITQLDKLRIHSASIYGQNFDAEVLGQPYENIGISMAGEHQVRNFLTALTAIKVLEKDGQIGMLTQNQLLAAAKKAKWKGRTELLIEEPITILDGAHNYDGAQMLCGYIQRHLSDKPVILVFGMLRDKDMDGVVSLLAPWVRHIVLTVVNNPRAASAEEMAAVVQKYKKETDYIIQEDIDDAIEYAQRFAKESGAAVIYAGSLYMIGNARTRLREKYQIEE